MRTAWRRTLSEVRRTAFVLVRERCYAENAGSACWYTLLKTTAGIYRLLSFFLSHACTHTHLSQVDKILQRPARPHTTLPACTLAVQTACAKKRI